METARPAEGLDHAKIRGAFRSQAKFCRDLGSPFVGRLCDLFAERLSESDGAVASHILDSRRAANAVSSALTLRIVGALHGLVLEGRSEELTSVFPPHHLERSSDELWDAIRGAMRDNVDFVLERLESAPQTNEVRRAAILLPGFLTIASLSNLPLTLSEIGASAGLNMCWDRFGYRLGEMRWGNLASSVQLEPEWKGAAPPSGDIAVRDRSGCDLSPPDTNSPTDRLRLLSYIWADQEDRFQRTRAALDIFRESSATVERGNVLDWLPKRLARAETGTVHVIYHTIVWQYLSIEAQKAGEAMIRDAGERASDSSPVAWLRFEQDGAEPGGAVTLTLWPPAEERCIARADYHGRWVDWLGW